MIRRVAGLTIMALTLLAHAQGDAPVQRPRIEVGDTWTYRRTDHLDGSKTLLRLEVTFANERAIHLVQTGPRGEKETDFTMTSEWNMVSSPTAGIFSPHSGLLRFPLRVGDSWPSSYTVTLPRQGVEVRHERTVRVLGWEEVQVPAGRFLALKVVSEGSLQRSDRPVAGRAKEAVWYVPEVKRFVKWTVETGSRMRAVQSWELEMVAYQLK